ncbi:unnamed protein product [Cyprideis torosa]|uniref:Uncharacterized protein n=1 Tax=Cyprideis torosa TaxID=163714 RepID=A0A7R8ZN55_9CRUS|nr:unnamed protein product [Cyprideis torosa]CAG0897176.1 unnamed protein product [Cyprideis torosa]
METQGSVRIPNVCETTTSHVASPNSRSTRPSPTMTSTPCRPTRASPVTSWLATKAESVNETEAGPESLQPAKERGNRLEDRGNRLEERGNRLEERGNRLEERGNRLEERGNRLEERGNRLEERGNRLEERGNRNEELECKAPPAIAHGVVEVPGFQGSYRYGQEAQYRCNPGYTIWGNATRFCNARAEWSGEAPTCQKIICAPPPRFENSIYILEDGSTGWNSIVTYHCLEGFVMNRERSNASTVCTDSGDWANVYVECIPGLLLPGPTIVEEASEFINNNNLEESRPEATSASEVISEPDARNQGPNPSTLEVILGLCAVATVVGIAVLILAYLFVKKRKDANYPSEKDFLNEFTSHCSCLERRENLYDEVYTPSASNRESHPDASLEPISIYDNGSRGNSSVAAQSGESSYDAPSLGNSGYDIPHQHRKRSGSSNHHRHHRHSPRHSPRSSPRHSPRSSPKYENLQFFRTGEQRRYENLILGTARSVTPINTSSPKHPVDATVVTQRHLSSSAKSSSPEPDGPPSSLMMVPASTPLYAQIDKARKRTRRSEAASPDGSSDSGRETADGASPSQPSSLLLPQPSPIIQKDRALEEEPVVGPDGEGVNDDTGSSIPDYESLGDPSRGPSRKNSTASSSYLRSLNDSRSLTGPRVMSTFGKGRAETEDTGVKNAGVVAEVKRLIYAQMDVSAPVAGASVQQDRTVYSNIRPSSLKPPSSPLGGNRKKNPPPKVPKKPPHLAGAGSTPPSSLVSTVSGQLKDSIDLV